MLKLRWRSVIASAMLALLALAVPQVTIAQDEAPSRPDARRDAPQRAQDERPRRAADEALKWIENIEIVRDVVYATITDEQGEERELHLDAAFPRQGGEKPLPAVVYIHGGGWSGGAREAGLPFTIAFANGGYFAVTISYRLSGEATYPAAVHDCKAAVRFLRANADALGIDPNRIGVWGHSAGGHLSAMLGLTGDNAALEGNVGTTGVSSSVACFVSVSGPAQLTGLTINGMVSDFLGGDSDEERAKLAKEASPVTHADRHDPPALLVHGTADELVNIRQSQLLNTTLRGAGATCELHEVEGAGHAIRDKAAYEKVAAFFDTHLGGSAARVFAEIDWQRLNEMRPVDAPRRGPRESDAPQANPSSPRDSALTQPLDAEALGLMSMGRLRSELELIAVALQRTPDLREDDRQRLKREFRIVRAAIRGEPYVEPEVQSSEYAPRNRWRGRFRLPREDSLPDVAIPAPLDVNGIKLMSRTQVHAQMARIATALRRAANLDSDTDQRLRDEFLMLVERSRELHTADVASAAESR